MADTQRARKMADRIQQTLAQLLDRRVKDPRLGFVTITEVRVTGDLQHATAFYTVLGDEDEREASAAALASATGMLRSEVGKVLGVRLTPSLEFVLDALPESAATLEDALRRAREHDAEVAQLAAEAEYIAGPDAYRTSEDDETDDETDGDLQAMGRSSEDSTWGLDAPQALDSQTPRQP